VAATVVDAGTPVPVTVAPICGTVVVNVVVITTLVLAFVVVHASAVDPAPPVDRARGAGYQPSMLVARPTVIPVCNTHNNDNTMFA